MCAPLLSSIDLQGTKFRSLRTSAPLRYLLAPLSPFVPSLARRPFRCGTSCPDRIFHPAFVAILRIFAFRAHAQDQFNSIDLSDNEIQKLENFPLLPKLKMLLLSNNRLARIAPGNLLPLASVSCGARTRGHTLFVFRSSPSLCVCVCGGACACVCR
jgi:Leucine-rich repeat (LRR) protein